jgi:hypothetical protein
LLHEDKDYPYKLLSSSNCYLRSMAIRSAATLWLFTHLTRRGRTGHLPLAGNYLAEEQADSLDKSWGFQNPKYRYKVHAEHRRLMEKDASAIVRNKGD